MGQSVGPNGVRPWTSAAGPYIVFTAREQVAELIGAHPMDVIFASCATESNNAAIAAALRANPTKRHIVTSQVEHSSVLNYCMALERGGLRSGGFTPPNCSVDLQSTFGGRRPPLQPNGGVNPPLREPGYRVTYLPVDRDGLLNLADLEAAITDETAVVSLMWANNETGVLFPVERIAEICGSRGVLYHCNAVQAAGKVEIDVRKIPVDYLSLPGHKFHAPKGIGALYVRRKSPFSPLVYGGHQEREMIRFSIDPAATRERVKSPVPVIGRQAEALRGVLWHP